MRKYSPIVDAHYCNRPHGDLFELRDRAEVLMGKICERELAGRPLYIVLSQEIAGFPMKSAICGLADPFTLGVAWQAEIGERWRGPGLTAIIDRVGVLLRARHKQHRTGCGDGSFSHFVRQAFFEVVVHEVAHLMLALPMVSARDGRPPLFTKASALRLRRDVLFDLAEPQSTASQKPWAGHDHRFIRAAAHLTHRVIRCTYIIDDAVFAGGRYALSPGHEYSASLAAEADRCRDASLLELLEQEPPERFQQLWAADTARFNFKLVADAREAIGQAQR